MNILIVEDEPLLAMDLEALIEDAGHCVIDICGDPHDALCVAHQADAAFVNFILRDGHTGTELASRLAEDFGIAVVFVTGDRDLADDANHPALAVVDKPFMADDIMDALEIMQRSLARLAV